jgi:hypothetical protein
VLRLRFEFGPRVMISSREYAAPVQPGRPAVEVVANVEALASIRNIVGAVGTGASSSLGEGRHERALPLLAPEILLRPGRVRASGLQPSVYRLALREVGVAASAAANTFVWIIVLLFHPRALAHSFPFALTRPGRSGPWSPRFRFTGGGSTGSSHLLAISLSAAIRAGSFRTSSSVGVGLTRAMSISYRVMIAPFSVSDKRYHTLVYSKLSGN